MLPLLEKHQRKFEDYSHQFIRGTEKDKYNIRLKIDHTLRVLNYSKILSEASPMNGQLRAVTHLAALYHDIGRFFQYEHFRTFNDRESANHAILGVRVLHAKAMLDDLPVKQRRLVYGAVAMHNRKTLPPKTPSPLKAICDVVRDSDKLDIYPVMIKHLEDKCPNSVVVMGTRPHPDRYTPALLEELMQGKICDYGKLTWTNDFKLLIASWAFDLNFSKSYTILRECGYLDRIFATLPATKVFRELRETLTLHVDKQIQQAGIEA